MQWRPVRRSYRARTSSCPEILILWQRMNTPWPQRLTLQCNRLMLGLYPPHPNLQRTSHVKMPTPEDLLAVERISAEDLAAALQSDAEHPVIVDVRNEDYELLGHIVNAEHLPAATFKEDADVDALVAKFGSKQNIVFHCGHSNTRGPTCALRFIERAEAAGVKTHVRVLAGGFADFAEKFSELAGLVTPPSKPTETE